MATETQTLAPYAGNIIAGEDLASENPGARAEVAEDCSHVTIIWIEPLAFHLEHWPEHMEHLLSPKTDADDEDESVYFTSEARQEFSDFMGEFLAGPKWEVQNADILPDEGEEWDDESCVAISYRFDTPNGPATTMEEFSDKSWPFIAAMTNVTDPGTFDNPYIMRVLADRIAAKNEED